MSPVLALAAILILSALLAIVSALAGALWMRQRSMAQRTLSPTPSLTVASPIPTPPATAGPVRPRPSTRVEAAEPISAGPTLIAVPDLGMTSGEANRGDDLGRRFGPIWELADAGATPEAIARATGQPVGQVELILNLRRPATSAAGERS